MGLLRDDSPRLCHPRDILEKHEAAAVALAARSRHGADHRARLKRAMELTPILGELGYNESHFLQTACCQVSRRRRAFLRRKPEGARVVVIASPFWVKDGPGYGKLNRRLDDRRPAPKLTTTRSINARFYRAPAEARNSSRTAVMKRPPKNLFPGHPSARTLCLEPAASSARRFMSAKRSLAAISWSLGGWERAHGYAANEHLLEKIRRPGSWCARASGTTAISGASPMPSIWR